MSGKIIRFFRTYWNGMQLTAMVRPGLCGYALDVDCLDGDGRKHPYFSRSYKDERGALRAMKTRFRDAEWEER